MYQLLPQIKSPDSTSSKTPTVPLDYFLSEAVFAGGDFLNLEAAYGRVDGVVKTITGYCGGFLKKPTYIEVCEGRTGHTEAVKVTYDGTKISFKSLCDVFWDSHDSTNKEFLNFGICTHHRSVIFFSNEEQRKQAQESKIRRQIKLNRRIVTKMLPWEGDFFIAENRHQKYYLQKHSRLCENLSLRSTLQFGESNLACKLNGSCAKSEVGSFDKKREMNPFEPGVRMLAMDEEHIVDKLVTFVKTHDLSKKIKTTCEEIIEHSNKKLKENTPFF